MRVVSGRVRCCALTALRATGRVLLQRESGKSVLHPHQPQKRKTRPASQDYSKLESTPMHNNCLVCCGCCEVVCPHG